MPRWELARQIIAAAAPICSFLVVLGSALIAWKALKTQRELARKKATIDVFIKTELDAHGEELWSGYLESMARLKACKSISEFIKPQQSDCIKIERYLNVFELISCGVRNEILDESITKNFYEAMFVDHFKKAEEYIIEIRKGSEKKYYFTEFEKMTKKGNRPQS